MKYFDYAATCPLDQDAASVYVKIATEHYGNSQSLHDIGDEASQLLENCRIEFSQMLNVEKEGIYFTSGGSEGNFLAIESLLSGNKKDGNHIITTIAEHSSIQSVIDRLKLNGFRITYLPFNDEGLIEVSEFAQAICEDTIMAVIQHGNSEIGTVQPIVEIGKLCQKHGILLHSDCVQTFGKWNLKQITPYIDSLSLSGHKFYGPKGTGAVYIRPQLTWVPVFPNTTHERGFRPGTINVAGIAAMTIAAKKANSTLDQDMLHYFNLRKILIDSLRPVSDQIIIHGSIGDQHQLPSIIGMSILGVEGQ
ncbi:MAG: cysteine desulfurase, partial [Bacillus sp. (in: firmicutes)]|nr:cysteine desulfurase [Bacillus sp. (in: firmicutes)]